MKIATFNVNGLRARLPIVLKWLQDNQPDVLCLQETKVQDPEFPADAFAQTGYKFVFSGQKSYNGVAVFSKSLFEDTGFGFDDEPKDQSRFLRTQINGITIINTYVPQGYMPDSEQFQYKLNWFRRLRKYFETNFKPNDAVLWVGDLNVAPEAIDVYDPEGLEGHVCFRNEVREAIKNVCSWGLVDLFRMHCKDSGRYTFWDYRERNTFKRNLGWRLDHIMATKALAEKCTTCYIDKEPRKADRPSDHTPVTAEFDW